MRLLVAVISRHSERAAERAATLEAVDAAVELGVGEDGFDHLLAFAIQVAACVGQKDAAYERVAAAVAAGGGEAGLADRDVS
jgi:hypothetical protein